MTTWTRRGPYDHHASSGGGGNLLTDVLFIDKGRIVLDSSLDDIATRYAAVAVAADNLDAARAEKPFHERPMLGKVVLYYEQPTLRSSRRWGRCTP